MQNTGMHASWYGLVEDKTGKDPYIILNRLVYIQDRNQTRKQTEIRATALFCAAGTKYEFVFWSHKR